MGEAEKFRDSRGDESAEANERPRRETEEEAPPAGPAGAGTAQGAPRDIWEPGQPREHPGTFGSRDSPGSTETSGSTGISQEASRTLGDPGHPREHPGHSEVPGHTVEQCRDPPEEHPGRP